MGSPNRNEHAKLPKLEISKFETNALNFISFCDHFDAAIHKNTNLEGIDKLNYLKSCRTDVPLRMIRRMS